MLEKYEATICGDKIEWKSDVPEAMGRNKRVDVVVTMDDKPVSPSKANRRRAVEALQALASINDRSGLKSIKDPVKWQRSIRKDRPLPAR